MTKNRRIKEHKKLSTSSEKEKAKRRAEVFKTLEKKLGAKGETFRPTKYAGKSAKYLASHYMDYLARQRFKTVFLDKTGGLSKEEAGEVLAHIVTPHQNKTLSEYRAIDRRIRGAITTLQARLQELRGYKAHLRGYILLWDTIEKAELMINSILHEVKDTKERKRIAKAEKPLMLFVDPQIDREGFISLETGYTKSKGNKQTPLLKSQIENITQSIIRSSISYISCHEATEDYMKNKGFKVKAYSQLLDHLKETAQAPAMTMLVKYRGEKGGEEGYDRVKELYDIPALAS